jgi:four helix bundle protein
MTFKKLEDIDVWKRGCRLAVSIYKMTVKSPFDKDWGLRDQIRRSSVSIPSNIAEGYERNSLAEFRRFLLIAKG